VRQDPNNYVVVSLPEQSRLGLGFIKRDQLPIIVFPYAAQLKMLELYDVEMNREDHCTLI
jgi:hypothetical protein